MRTFALIRDCSLTESWTIRDSMVCSNEAMCDPWVNPEQYTGVMMEYYNNKLPRSQSPDGPVQGPLVLSEKLLRSLPLPQIRQRHGVRGEREEACRRAQRKPK